MEKNLPLDLTIDQVIDKGSLGLGTLRLLIGPSLLIALEGCQVIIMSVVGLILKCEWNISTFYVALLQSVVFLGMGIGGLLASRPTDKYGRKPVMIVGITGIMIAGTVSGFSVNYWQLFISTFFSGAFVGVSCGPATAYVCEVSPTKFRALIMTIINMAWGVGSVIAISVAFFTLPYANLYWQGFIIISTLVFLPVLPLIVLSPESPRYTASQGKTNAAEAVLKTLLKQNNKPCEFTLVHDGKVTPDNLITTSLALDREISDEDSPLIKGKMSYLRPMVLICTASMCGIYTLYATGFSNPRFLNEEYCGFNNHTDLNHTSVTTYQPTNDQHQPTYQPTNHHDQCTFSTRVLRDLILVTLLDPVGPVLCSFVANCLGRKRTLYLFNLLTILVCSIMHVCVTRGMLVFELMIMKGLGNIVNWLPFLIACEYFPTHIRGRVMSFIFGIGKCGSVTAIVMTQFLYNYSPRLFIGSIQIAQAIGICMAFLLKKETNGMPLDG